MKIHTTAIRFGAVCAVAILTWSGVSSTPRRQSSAKATYTISTAELGRNVRGYRGPVPVAVTFEGGKIKEIKILPNHETPSYFRRVEQAGITQKFIGLTPKQASSRQVDAVSGATLSSRALIENYCCPVKLRTAKNNLLKR